MCSITWQTYTVNQTVDAVQLAVSNYYSLNAISPDTFGYNLVPDASGGADAVFEPPLLVVTSYTNSDAMFVPGGSFVAETAQTTYTLNATSFGPLDYAAGADALRQFFNALVTMELQLPELQNFAFGTIYRNCYRWKNTITYDFTNRGQIQ